MIPAREIVQAHDSELVRLDREGTRAQLLLGDATIFCPRTDGLVDQGSCTLKLQIDGIELLRKPTDSWEDEFVLELFIDGRRVYDYDLPNLKDMRARSVVLAFGVGSIEISGSDLSLQFEVVDKKITERGLRPG